ncbi:cystathionine gamma-synthase family protein [Pseudomonas corrugata]|uniref:cystathionine gamma-synthase family protein n=1 Tax=Pseudomonas corrugata TaxID=47879 RepID=UPI0006D8ABE6|nr:cystathionine gamma-synthase family protein [Pseudomonas corrugata]MDU9024945.1 cystathionine gamma-synthase family protein [Pseudomonas corrugata]MDU9036286.1 cystathionine gamma-synthase family protein [Pseudomonas corrugata]UZD94762.1 cystathionine gamma-synthase family protein [Pseudomonas corrugata]UZE05656.1 cystathionine gamma-synthase family protein [Pseudomonas corrugata]
MNNKPDSAGLDNAGAGTRAVWGGEQVRHPYNATQTPIVVSAAYGYDDIDVWYDVALGKAPGFIYSRMSNPTVETLEAKIRELEMAESAVAFSTGMAAISSVLYTFLAQGDRVVSTKDSYGGTNKIFEEFLPRMGVEATLCETFDHDEIEREIAKGCQVVYLETPTNPTLKILDIQRLVAAAKRVGAVVVADNTFATPLNQNPLALGVDVVIHSATKFLSGHGDVLGGLVCGSESLMAKVRHYREINGAALDPFSAFMIIRGMKTLVLRMRQQQASARALAEFLCTEPLVESVNYPGLPSHPNHAVACAQMAGFGAIVSFVLVGGMDTVTALLPRLRFAHCAGNLGAVETIYGPARTTSHVENTLEERLALGISEGLVRVSVGIEDTDDLLDDLKQAFAFVRASREQRTQTNTHASTLEVCTETSR